MQQHVHAPAVFHDVETPCLLLDVERVLANLARLRSAFGMLRPRIFYAAKANGDPRLLAALHAVGCGFDVASLNEIRRLQALGVPAADLTFSATVKLPSHIREAAARRVDCFAIDNPTEVAKLAHLAPGAKVIVRLEVPHQGSRWPLGGKFGLPADEAVDLLHLAAASGLRPYGVTFHVGSQCLRPETWHDAIRLSAGVWHAARGAGLALRVVNLGGGLPARYTEDVPAVAEIGALIQRWAPDAFGADTEYAIEPGRCLVADAGTLVTTVIGKAHRRGKPWLFVDQSIYAGLLEVIGGWTYPMTTRKDHLPRHRVTLAGPSCDSTDIIAADVALPDLDVGDQILLHTAGAYTTSYQDYNGLSFPQVVVTKSSPVVCAAGPALGLVAESSPEPVGVA
jgi:ornithine decarboxylase